MAIFAHPPPPPPPPYGSNSPPSRTPSRATTRSRSTTRSASLTMLPANRNRSLSVRHRKGDSASDAKAAPIKHRFTMGSLRGMQQPDLSRRLYKLIKTENHAISAYESAARERISIATQLSDWGESTGDDAVSDLSDKLGVLLAEIGEQEELFAQNLEEYRAVLKEIRNTESSVQPSRVHKAKVSDEIQKLKYKEPASTKIPQLEQELVRAEAQSLVAEAQLTNITRQKFKEAFDLHMAATVERAEKQIILAKQARRLLNLLDDSPIVPGEGHEQYNRENEAREVLNDAEDELKSWTPRLEPVATQAAGLGAGAMPQGAIGAGPGEYQGAGYQGGEVQSLEHVHPAHRGKFRANSAGSSPERRVVSTSTVDSVASGPPYPISAEERERAQAVQVA